MPLQRGRARPVFIPNRWQRRRDRQQRPVLSQRRLSLHTRACVARAAAAASQLEEALATRKRVVGLRAVKGAAVVAVVLRRATPRTGAAAFDRVVVPGATRGCLPIVRTHTRWWRRRCCRLASCRWGRWCTRRSRQPRCWRCTPPALRWPPRTPPWWAPSMSSMRACAPAAAPSLLPPPPPSAPCASTCTGTCTSSRWSVPSSRRRWRRQ